MLFCMAALQVLHMDLHTWHTLYTDLPSRQQKVSVPDKGAVTCSDDETTVLRPAALQEDLQAAMAQVECGRCFVRPSGTEDVVRIYAEAATPAEADKLTALTYAAIRKHLG
jgi:phosphoacetylglucosamine mutase